MNARISTLVRQMHEAWNYDGKLVDTLLWVPAPRTAVPFDKYTYLGFTRLFNVIDWPAMALPLGMFVDKYIDIKTGITLFNALDDGIQGLYDPESFHGLPLSVQLIGRRFEDEKLLAVSRCARYNCRPTSNMWKYTYIGSMMEVGSLETIPNQETPPLVSLSVGTG
ncbi:hypothetical protein ASPVEDRAFT_392212 [Aspergillus versicolor CBS 583.65]|uniref:Uncharacterized protein n=1 Tax=Aspergillus versicolor CBS 583.65 TaxID=1036611 RepID=A0A1L9Q399_ASPVE|nr:uncharacterized protein ASPVEDRAFT_392212 [Aspergillus versicolor CBS 583.65]OJJ08227.1 hypothetical protein ASPVEDRAFT_392212 [Aspergillus versicolor CBS 583.65]